MLSVTYQDPNWAISPNYVFYTLDTWSGAATLMSDIVNTLKEVGWTFVTRITAVGGLGVTLRCDSPQLGMGLFAFCDIVAYAGYVTIQMHQTEYGYIHVLSSNQTLQMGAGNCSFYIHSTVTGNTAGSVVCAGIPFIQPLQVIEPDYPPPTEVWYSIGDGFNNPFFYGNTWRNQLGFSDWYGAVHAWCGYYEPVPYGVTSPLTMPSFGSAIQVEMLTTPGTYNAAQTPMTYPNGSPILYEPMISWGDHVDTVFDYTYSLPKIRGQLYDAFVKTGVEEIDYVIGTNAIPPDGCISQGTFQWETFTYNNLGADGTNQLASLYIRCPNSIRPTSISRVY